MLLAIARIIITIYTGHACNIIIAALYCNYVVARVDITVTYYYYTARTYRRRRRRRPIISDISPVLYPHVRVSVPTDFYAR